MRRLLGAAVVTVLACGAAASANMHQTLQLDINQIAVQSRNAAGVNSPFGGLNHTGSIEFSFAGGITHLLGIFLHEPPNPPANMGFTGSLTDLTGVLNLNNGQVSGGHLLVTVNGTDTYATQVSNAGSVTPFAGGGYRVEGLTFDGMFSGPMFGNVDVSTWFNVQPFLGGHPGSFLKFNFNPDQSGAAYADMDVFIEVIPLPPAAWMGLATMMGIAGVGYIKRRRRE